jgi:hypothetical protein
VKIMRFWASALASDRQQYTFLYKSYIN